MEKGQEVQEMNYNENTLQNDTPKHLHWSNMLNCSTVLSHLSLNDFTAQYLESKKAFSGYGLKWLLSVVK